MKREDGYSKEIERRGIEFDKEMVENGDLKDEIGYWIERKIMERNKSKKELVEG